MSTTTATASVPNIMVWFDSFHDDNDDYAWAVFDSAKHLIACGRGKSKANARAKAEVAWLRAEAAR